MNALQSHARTQEVRHAPLVAFSALGVAATTGPGQGGGTFHGTDRTVVKVGCSDASHQMSGMGGVMERKWRVNVDGKHGRVDG